MSAALLSLMFDGTLALLLVLTISYCNKLHKKIRQLQDGRSELAEMISRFDKSTERATTSLSELQVVSKKITDALQLKIDKANFLADDLAFLIEKSSKLAVQLDQQQKHRTEMHKPALHSPGLLSAQKATFSQTPNPAEKNGPQKPSATKTGIEQLIASSSQVQTPSVASIEAMLNKLAANSTPPRTVSSQTEPSPRTNAERELLNALKSER